LLFICYLVLVICDFTVSEEGISPNKVLNASRCIDKKREGARGYRPLEWKLDFPGYGLRYCNINATW
jgi:hypothetical protein